MGNTRNLDPTKTYTQDDNKNKELVTNKPLTLEGATVTTRTQHEALAHKVNTKNS